MNKRKLEEMDLRAAFPEMPQDCHDALLRAARSAGTEETKMKHFTVKTVLLTALLVIFTTTAAVAATEALGWTDFFSQYYGTQVPAAAQRIMKEEWNRHHFSLGPVSYDVQELYCDGHIAMASTVIKMEDGGKALLLGEGFEPSDALGANGENGAALAGQLGLSPSATWLDAAKELKLPLYRVRAILEVPEALSDGVETEDPLYNDDGSLTYFSLCEMNGTAYGEKIACQLFLRLAEIDLETGDEQNVSASREMLEIFLEAPGGQFDRKYEDISFGGFQLDTVHMEWMPAGLYLFSTFTAQDGVTQDQAYETLYRVDWVDENGVSFPRGLSLTESLDTGAWPAVTLKQMISVDAIPEHMSIRVPDGQLFAIK